MVAVAFKPWGGGRHQRRAGPSWAVQGSSFIPPPPLRYPNLSALVAPLSFGQQLPYRHFLHPPSVIAAAEGGQCQGAYPLVVGPVGCRAHASLLVASHRWVGRRRRRSWHPGSAPLSRVESTTPVAFLTPAGLLPGLEHTLPVPGVVARFGPGSGVVAHDTSSDVDESVNGFGNYNSNATETTGAAGGGAQDIRAVHSHGDNAIGVSRASRCGSALRAIAARLVLAYALDGPRPFVTPFPLTPPLLALCTAKAEPRAWQLQLAYHAHVSMPRVARPISHTLLSEQQTAPFGLWSCPARTRLPWCECNLTILVKAGGSGFLLVCASGLFATFRTGSPLLLSRILTIIPVFPVDQWGHSAADRYFRLEAALDKCRTTTEVANNDLAHQWSQVEPAFRLPHSELSARRLSMDLHASIRTHGQQTPGSK